jgi:hypothetical protein
MPARKLQHSVRQNFVNQLSADEDVRDFLMSVSNREIDPYRDVQIQNQKTGKSRSISIPEPILAEVQKVLLNHLESMVGNQKTSKSKISEHAHAYVKGRSQVTAAKVHTSMRWGVKVDIESFFDHISEVHVVKALTRAGIPQYEAEAIATICTRVPFNYPSELPPKYSRFTRTIKPAFTVLDTAFVKALKDIPAGMSADKTTLGTSEAVLVRREYNKSSLPHFGKKSKWRLPLELKYQEDDTQFVIPPKKAKRLGALNKLDPKAFVVKSPDRMTKSLGRRFKLVRQAFQENLNVAHKIFKSQINPGASGNRLPTADSYLRKVKLGYLPQGASTSGFLANLVMADFDYHIAKHSRNYGLRYSRYSDDIVLSSRSNSYTKEKALKTISFLQQSLEFYGFTLNKGKTKIITPGSRKFVLGLLVDTNSVRLPAKIRDRITSTIWKVATQGDAWIQSAPQPHLLNESHFLPHKRRGSHLMENTPSDPMSSLLGWLSYCKVADRIFLSKVHSKLARGRWKFENPAHEKLIKNHVGNLLSTKSEQTKVAPTIPPKAEYAFRSILDINS